MAENPQNENEQTATEEEAPPAPEVTVEETGPARQKLKIQVPEERIQQKTRQTYDYLQNEATLPGFRPGKAPRRLIEKRFGKDIQRQVKGELLNEAYSEAIEQQELDVLGDPEMDTENIELPESGPLEFEVEVEVRPQFELPDFAELEVNKPGANVTDQQVADEIKQYQERFGQMESVEGAEVQIGDFVQGDVHVLAGEDAGDDAEVLEHHPGAYVLINGEDMDYRGHVAGIVVEDMGQRLPGKKVGEVERISMTGPSSHENEQIKDQPITITLRIDQVQRVQPADIATVVEQAGLESEDELRQQVRQMLEQRAEREQQTEMQRQVTDQLSEKVDMELPEGLTGKQTEQVLQRRQMELLSSGTDPQELEQKMAEARAESEEQARKQLKEHFILDRAASDLEVEVNQNELNSQITMMAMQQGQRPEQMRQQMQKEGRLQQLYLQVRERKTLDAILEQATVHEPEGEETAATENGGSESGAQESGGGEGESAG